MQPSEITWALCLGLWACLISRASNEFLQLCAENPASDLRGRVAFCDQPPSYVTDGAAAARPCQLKCSLKHGRVMIHGCRLSGALTRPKEGDAPFNRHTVSRLDYPIQLHHVRSCRNAEM